MLANNGGPDDAAADDAARGGGAARRAERALPATAPSLLEPCVDGPDGALAALLAPVAEAMSDGTWARVKACRADDCQWAFYDFSRNRSGTWCDMAVCGNREKVRAYRAAHREMAPAAGAAAWSAWPPPREERPERRGTPLISSTRCAASLATSAARPAATCCWRG